MKARMTIMHLQTTKIWSNVPIAPQCGLDIPESECGYFEWEVGAFSRLAELLRCSQQARWITDESLAKNTTSDARQVSSVQQLEEAANRGDERAFLRAMGQMEWLNRP